jgi:hypothetical protein
MTRPRKSRPSAGEELSPTFEEDYLDVDGWPNAWRVEPADLARGKVIVDLFKVFLIDQLKLSRSRKTLRVHRDNLHALGGQIIRQWHQHPHARKRGILRMLLDAIGDDGGPILYPSRSEADQRSFDSTCRLLHRFTSMR